MLGLSAQMCLRYPKVADALRSHGTSGINVPSKEPWVLISLWEGQMGRAY